MFTLIYCYDPYCGWCYGFSSVIKKIAFTYKEFLSIEVLSGGMILPGKPVHISATAPYIQKSYKEVENLTGVQFGEHYLWHVYHAEESDWYPDSEKPSVALSICKELYPSVQLEFATDLQYALHFEGRDLCDDHAYFHLLEKYGIDKGGFIKKLSDPGYKEMAQYEFALVKHLKVTGYPTLFIQTSESNLYEISRGYADYDTIRKRIDHVLLNNKIIT
jgi:putative protein-disulfide isomerase